MGFVAMVQKQSKADSQQLTPPLSGQTVRLKSLDVDDPTSWDADEARIIDPNDKTAGFRGLDNQSTNASVPGAGVLAQTVLTLNTQGEATTTLTLPMAPGNNFRLAALLDTAAPPPTSTSYR